jgi:transposase InsO family protein
VNDRYALIQQLASEHPISVLCTLLAVRRGGYYTWQRRATRPRQQEDARLAPIVAEVFAATRRTYGRVRLTRELKARGHACGERRVARLLRAQGLQARPRRRFRPQTTDSRHADPIAPRRSLGDGLHLPAHRRPPVGLIHHSDRGSQYASAAYRAALAAHGLLASMSRAANPYDNAAMESFYSMLKTECLAPVERQSPAATEAMVFDYVETFYNRRRRHSALGYQSPVDFEQQLN